METLIGKSAQMMEIFDVIPQIAPKQCSLLLEGESGTGKNLLTRTIHELSGRHPFITVSCVSRTDRMLEGELFGHEKGAYFGAYGTRMGWLEQAHGGTLFFDEIADIPTAIQVRLLRYLNERSFERLGAHETRTADVRLVAATKKNLKEMVKDGTFSETLYYRLPVIHLSLPALRERLGDISLLAQHFLQEFSDKLGKKVSGFTPGALEKLIRHSWPGNVRELRAAMEYAVILCRGDRITTHDLLVPAFPNVN